MNKKKTVIVRPLHDYVLAHTGISFSFNKKNKSVVLKKKRKTAQNDTNSGIIHGNISNSHFETIIIFRNEKSEDKKTKCLSILTIALEIERFQPTNL